MSALLANRKAPLGTLDLHDHLAGLTVHDSPPPTLTARFASDSVRATLPSSSPHRKGVQPEDDEERRRSPPPGYKNPLATLEKFIEHLLSIQHCDSDPHLVAIGYELEALLAIYPSLKLAVSSRPASLVPAPRREAPSDPAPVSEADADANATSTPLKPAATLTPSKSWTDAEFDESVWTPGERIRYEISLPIWDEGEVLPNLADPTSQPKDAPIMRVLVSLPPTYPHSAAPQLQLLGRYLGNFGIDAGLFGDVTRTFITSSGVPFSPGDVCVFEGLTYARGVAQAWYAARLSEGLEGEKARDVERRRGQQGRAMAGGGFPTSPARGRFADKTNDDEDDDDERLADESNDQPHRSKVSENPSRPSPRPTFSYSRPSESAGGGGGATWGGTDTDSGPKTPPAVVLARTHEMPHFTIHVSAPLVDRKSTFVGHAIAVTDEREVPLVIHEILSDKRVARAAHPAMFAYRIVKDVGGVAGKVVLADCDDDGETAAGSRLAHLLEILEAENVLVVVSRWYGGVLLGADRFKHINQAARDALDVGGFLGGGGGSGGKDKEGKGRRR